MQATQLLHLGCLQPILALAPQVERLLADAMLPGNVGRQCFVGLTKDLDHLVFAESG